ncbi:hypothetical protein C2U72_08070 [Prosthecomicrobium hirschii]|nr:hypothetical protein C2U72_08070 [Prosthecomicrobium hirschii]
MRTDLLFAGCFRRYHPAMSSNDLKTALIATPLLLAALGASLWLWARWGLGVYFDAAMGALAGCF